MYFIKLRRGYGLEHTNTVGNTDGVIVHFYYVERRLNPSRKEKMIAPTVQTSYRNLNRVETYKENFIRLIGKKHEARVNVLPKGTFDPVLWMLLNQRGPSSYHYAVKDELIQGYLWIQENDCMDFNVLWSNEMNLIFRAIVPRLEEKSVVIECYSSHIVNVSIKSEQVSIQRFIEIIEDYLQVTPLCERKLERSEQARLFEKKMELMSLVFKISKAAAAFFVELIKKCPFNVSVVIGADDKNNQFNPKESTGIELIEISKHFLIGRLCYLHQKDHRPDQTMERVAPSLHSWEAFSQLKDLKGQNDANLSFPLDSEREVFRKFPESVAVRNLKDLRAYLIIDQGIEYLCEAFVITDVSKGERERMEFSIDFLNDQWHLEQKVVEQ